MVFLVQSKYRRWVVWLFFRSVQNDDTAKECAVALHGKLVAVHGGGQKPECVGDIVTIGERKAKLRQVVYRKGVGD